MTKQHSKTRGKNVWPIVILLATLVLLPSEGVAADSERLAHETRNGVIVFQVQNPQVAQYSLELRDFLTGQIREVVTNFQAAAGVPWLSATWQPTLTNQLLDCRLLKDGIGIPLPSLPLKLPEVWQGVPAELNRRNLWVEWNLPRDSLVRVRAALESGLDLAVVKDWHFAPSGANSAAWDFQDQHKTANFANHPSLQVVVQRLALPLNLVVVGQPDFRAYARHPLFEKLDLPRLLYSFELTLNCRGTNAPSKADDIPIVSPGCLLTVRLSAESKKILNHARYEVLFFVEGAFLREDTEGVDPCSTVLPDLAVKSGPVQLAAMVRDYSGNSGLRIITARYQPREENSKK